MCVCCVCVCQYCVLCMCVCCGCGGDGVGGGVVWYGPWWYLQVMAGIKRKASSVLCVKDKVQRTAQSCYESSC